MQTFTTTGTCSREILFDITDDNKIARLCGNTRLTTVRKDWMLSSTAIRSHEHTVPPA